MDIGPFRRVIQVTLQPAPHRADLELDAEFEDVEEDVEDR